MVHWYSPQMFRLMRKLSLMSVFTVGALPFGTANAGEGPQHFVLLGPNTLRNCSSLQSGAPPKSDERFLVIEANTIRGDEWRCQLNRSKAWSWQKDIIHSAKCALDGVDSMRWFSFYSDTFGFHFFFSAVEPAKGRISYGDDFYSCLSHATSFAARVVDITEGDYSCEIEVATTDGKREQLSANFELCSNIQVGKTYRFTQGPIAILDCDGQLPCTNIKYTLGVLKTMSGR